ncbi:MAG: thioredoxin family protein [Paracoccaceae bacterium]
MERRAFLALSAAATFAPASAFANGFVDYTPGAIKAALAAGQTVFVDYSAVWCSTCHRQERVINSLRDRNKKYDNAMVFFKVDWDNFGRHKVATSRGIPRRSTLIVLRGDKELGRIVAGTSESQIQALMDRGL